MSLPRIVSLLPSSTEIVCALGFRGGLVGRSHECDYPTGLSGLPICTEPKIKIGGTSAEIDRQVKSILEQALSVYRVHADKLKNLRPDLVVTQSQCEVCAVSLKDVEKVVCEFLESRPRLVSLEPNSLEDVFKDFSRVANALGVEKRGEELIESSRERMGDIAKKTANLAERPSVACIEWIEPLMGAGNWMPTLVEMAGAKNLVGRAGEHSPWMKWEELLALDPETIVVLPCGFSLEKAWQELGALTSKKEWKDLRAVRAGRVFVTDGHHYFNRPGPRLVESLEILAEIFHPGIFNFGHEGRGWRRYATS